ncbi:hypothetical protein FNU76_09445 [Chitinimonas arctica]|uniref:L-lysine 6-oxidase n=1 Tax=Chitinimonas arctica TaxID=2594795 RepID=A0A516SEW7_9NEIS|nr:CTQ-dependent lysine 6-oxidase LodA [Chitinimonas arctica]QDQ26578.1 hypothetical protein FNU76_09445 [Chitinimonas arctica]
MAKHYSIHPKIGIARVGNSPQGFYIGPETTGGLPIECDKHGNAILCDGKPVHTDRFKDAAGAIKRQAARFKVFEHGGGAPRELSLQDGSVASICWTVHIANKKAVWYSFAELNGDLMFGADNSYEAQHVPLRNPDIPNAAVPNRQQYIIDPGPRSVSQPGQRNSFSRYNIPKEYTKGAFPPVALSTGIDTLGDLMMDDAGNLLVLGGFGVAGGQGDISSFAGANNWFDDVSDGYVLARLTLKDGSTIDLEPAWLVVGSPKYAPELINIITLDDTVYDVAVRNLQYDPQLYDPACHPIKHDGGYNPIAGFNPNYQPNYERDIKPIIVRPQSYRWVANVPSMIDFSRPDFDTSDPSEANRALREEYFSYYRVPVPAESYRYINEIKNGPNQLFSDDGLPLMPLNSGDNSVTNDIIYKFLTLTPTQYFFMHQWAKGKFSTGPAASDDRHGVTALDRETIGNCVGGPFSPGIEVTWIVRNPLLYSKPFQVRIAHWQGSNLKLEEYYYAEGLSTTSDPQNGQGTEPGDLTKRMAIPWQADFFDCTVQTPNITNPAINQSPADDGIQVPPAYYVYWWPPQSPMQVYAGSVDPADQALDGFVSNAPVSRPNANGVFQVLDTYSIVAAGTSVNYQRGINSFNQMVVSWQDLGFIVNKGTERYPYFVESERNTTYLAQGTATGIK